MVRRSLLIEALHGCVDRVADRSEVVQVCRSGQCGQLKFELCLCVSLILLMT